MSEWKYRGILRRDFRHIHHEEREFFPKMGRRRRRYKHHVHEYGPWTNGSYWKSRRCNHCRRKETEYNWSSDNFNRRLAAPKVNTLADHFASLRAQHICYRRDHHGKYKVNRERLVQRRGF